MGRIAVRVRGGDLLTSELTQGENPMKKILKRGGARR